MGERKDAMPRTRSALAVVIGLAALVAPGQAFALCSACTAVVRLDAGLADCFVHKAAEEMKALQAGAAIVVVDLADCPDRGGLPTGDASEPAPQLDNRFIADSAAIQCLSNQIAQLSDSDLDPSHAFDLSKGC
jgi:hypothetical protein